MKLPPNYSVLATRVIPDTRCKGEPKIFVISNQYGELVAVLLAGWAAIAYLRSRRDP